MQINATSSLGDEPRFALFAALQRKRITLNVVMKLPKVKTSSLHSYEREVGHTIKLVFELGDNR